MPLTAEQRADIYALWNDKYELIADDVTRSTVAVFGHGNGVTQQFGSGVLFKIANRHFVLTAAHVVDHGTIHKIPFAISPVKPGEPPIQLTGVDTGTTPVPSGRKENDPHMRDDDPLDVGFVELTSEMVARTCGEARFATLDEVDTTDGLLQGCYLIYGFPCKFSAVNEKTRIAYSQAFRYLTDLYDEPTDRFDPAAEIRLKYPEVGMTYEQRRIQVPNPKGMSGCGIWRIMDMKPPSMWTRSDVKLAAIDHMWHGQRRYIQGTRLRVLMFMLYRNYPDLRLSMDLYLGAMTRGW